MDLPENFANEPSSSIALVYDRCPVCDEIGKSLTCHDCMKNHKQSFLVLEQGQVKGDRRKLASVMFIPRVVQEKLKHFHEVYPQFKDEQESISKQVEDLSPCKRLESEVAQFTNRIKRLKGLLTNKKRELQREKQLLAESHRRLPATQKKINKILEKKKKLKDYVDNKQNNIKLTLKQMQSVNIQLHAQRKEHVRMLTKYIFPIEEIRPSLPKQIDKNEESSDDDVISLQEELAEASRLAFVNGKWVDQEVGVGTIVEISVGADVASAPSDGNYSQYESWLESNHSTSGSNPPITSMLLSQAQSAFVPSKHSEVLATGAALCHAAQLVRVIQRICAFHLPYKVHFKIFSDPTVSSKSFINSVKLFNSNLLNLCLSQGVDGSTLDPLRTLRNLQILVGKLEKDGCRLDPFLPSHNILISMEEALGLRDVLDEPTDDDDDFDWQLSINDEWETVSHVDTVNTSPSAVTFTSTNTQSSILSQPAGLVTSALDWATKGWWTAG
ncbi:beclin 1-associated autophagy-related key regulator-like isoform X2 [Clavelina lepadiformis]|uniref:Beclin 1-associated autophagy-related key regulator n=1 Tax=Clavelina lepadiformis TaxID=159417 RepID=A0ABP0GSE8_CLALP